jgi:hypothetical protein
MAAASTHGAAQNNVNENRLIKRSSMPGSLAARRLSR